MKRGEKERDLRSIEKHLEVSKNLHTLSHFFPRASNFAETGKYFKLHQNDILCKFVWYDETFLRNGDSY